MKNLIKTIVFFVLLFFCINILGSILKPNFITDSLFKNYQKEPQNSLDALFIGDSGVYFDISPMQMYEDYGIASYNVAFPAITNILTYYLIQEAVKTQTPQVIVMDATKLFGIKDRETMVHRVVDTLPLDDVKKDIINDPVYNFSFQEKLGFYIPFYRYHDNWTKANFSKVTQKKINSGNDLKGFYTNGLKKKASNEKSYMIDDGKEAQFQSDYIPQYILKSKKYCEDHNIKFLIITMPDTKDWNYEKSVAAKKWCKDNDIDYLDFNTILDEVGIDFENDSADGGEHLNISGSTKLSKYLGKYLKDNYDLADHRNDVKYSKWDKDLKKYNELKEKNYALLQNSAG